jgi:hypothetical protein
MNLLPADLDKIAYIPERKFVDKIPQLYAPLRGYISGVLPLMLEHAWQLKTKNHCSAEDALDSCGWVGRLITLDTRVLDKNKQNEIPGWFSLKLQLLKCIDNSGNEKTFAAGIKECMELVNPVVEQRFVKGYHFPPRLFHCWWYTIHDDKTKLALHLVNAYQPASPFDKLHHFLSTMLQAIDHATMAYPGIAVISCGSWLNQLPKFQAIWPGSFKMDQVTLNETGGFGPGAWGQYMKTNSEFDQEKANHLRKTGFHPFKLTEAQSPISEVIAHLKNLILKTGT